MKNKLTEQQIQAQLLAEFDAINKLGRGLGRVAGSAAKGVGAVAGGVAGLGSAVKKGYQAGKQTVGGGGADMSKGQTTQQAQPNAQAGTRAPNTQAQPKAQAGAQATNTQAQTQIKKPGFLKRAAGAVSTGIGKADAFAQKALDKVDDVSNYDWRQDDAIKDRSKQTYTGVGGAQIGKNPKSSNLTQKNQAAGMAAGLQKADAEAQRKAGLEKKLGTTGAAATAANTAKTATDKSIARNQKKNAKQKTSGIKQGMDNATMVPTGVLGPDGKMTMRPGIDKNKDGKDDKSGKPMAPAPAGKGPVGGAGGAAAQVDANKDGKDDKTGKPMSKTALDVKNKANVTAGGVKMDPNNPQHQALIAAIEKASPGTTKAIDALDPPSKEKLKKAIA